MNLMSKLETDSRRASYFLGLAAFVAAILSALFGIPYNSWYFGFTITAIVTSFFSVAAYLFSVHSSFDECRSALNECHSTLIECRKALVQKANELECYYVGDRETALRYVIDQCHHQPLKMIRDTHVRTTSPLSPYSNGTYQQIEDGFRKFLERRPDAQLFMVTGPQTDPKLMERMNSLVNSMGEKQITFYQLKQNTPMLSVLILDFANGEQEVLFGWGKLKEEDTDAVFRSKNTKLVAEFMHYFDALAHSPNSKEVPASSLLSSSIEIRVPSGPERFWAPYCGNGTPSTIVFTEPLCFRVFGGKGDQEERYFLRDIDINDDETALAEVKNKLPWLNNYHVVKSRAYIPGGEALAIPKLQSWLRNHGAGVCSTEVSRKTTWEEGQFSLGNLNLIVLGSVRTNSAVVGLRNNAGYDERFRYRHEPKGISILMPTPEEDRVVRARYTSEEPRRLLSENWDTESLVLVTRGLNQDRTKVVTAILANQGRGIAAVISYLMIDHNWSVDPRGLKRFNLPPTLPTEFQMIFEVELDKTDFEARAYARPLLYYSLE
jgi:hypothetical protein